MSIWVKDPLDTAWFEFDWSQFLETGETIVAHTTTVDANLTNLGDNATPTTVSVRVSGGVNGSQSLVTCQVITSSGNTYETEKYINIATRISN
jgi:hypothetical protein